VGKLNFGRLVVARLTAIVARSVAACIRGSKRDLASVDLRSREFWVFHCHFGLGDAEVPISGQFSHVLDVEFVLR